MVQGEQVLSVPTFQLGVWRSELVLAATVLASLAPLVWPRLRSAVPVTAGLAVATGLAFTTLPTEPVEPLGPHFVVSGAAALVRLVVVSLALVVQLAWRPRDQRAGCMLALAALGSSLLAQAATLAGLLVAAAAAALGGGLAAWFAGRREGRAAASQWLAASGLGFGILAFAGALWCGLAGTLELAAIPAALAAGPSLPPLALPVLLSLAGAGLAMMVMGEPGRFRRDDRGDPHPELVGWLTLAPALAAAVLLQRLAAGAVAAPKMSVAAPLTVAMAAVLIVVGFVAAMAQTRFSRRLAWAASGQAGLALLAFAAPATSAAVAAPVLLLLAVAPAHVGAMLLAGSLERGDDQSRWREPQLMLLSVLLVSLAGLPPLAGWRPRLDLFAGLGAGGQHLGLATAALGSLLAVVVYLWPLVDLWRAPAADTLARAPATAPGWGPAVPTLLAAGLLAGLLGWGLGLLDPTALLS